jgi:hypothetical protein
VGRIVRQVGLLGLDLGHRWQLVGQPALRRGDAAAKDKVGEIAAALGYRVIDAGGLRMARALEEMAFLNISLNAANGWPWQSAWKLVGPTGNL